LLKKSIRALASIIFLSVSALTQTMIQKEGNPVAATLDERLGPDDGAAVAMLIGANMRGNIELCDCNNPRGGLARRVGFIEAYKNKFKAVTIVQVEAGNFLTDSSYATPAQALQNEQMAQALSRWPVDVINLGRFDIFYAHKLLAREGLDARSATLPMIKKIISANGNFNEGAVAPPPYLIKEVTGPRIKGKKKKLKIGFLGLAEPIRPAEGRDGLVKDVFETARRFVPELRAQCDVVVIVAHSELAGALRLARENPEADVVIAGNAEGLFNPRQVGETIVVSAAPGNIQEGDLRLYLSEDGHITYKFRAIELDAVVPSDPAAARFVDTAHQEREKIRYN